MMRLPESFINIEIIRENQRFATAQATHEGKQVFVKQVIHPSLVESIRNEAWGIQAFQQLARVGELPFLVPNITSIGNDYIATSWARGSASQLDSVEFYAQSLYVIDSMTAFSTPMKSNFIGEENRLKTKLDALEYNQYFDHEMIQKCLEYITTNTPHLEARLTHADFTPNNVMMDGKIRTLIDYESTSLLWPRFYDLVNMTYNRIITEPKYADNCTGIVNRYFELQKTDPVRHIQQLNCIAMVRSLSLITELLSEPNAEHNTSVEMTGEIANKLNKYMERILRRQLYFV